MSAYGAIPKPSCSETPCPLPSTLWHLKSRDTCSTSHSYVTIHHLTLATARALSGLLPYLHAVFADELERGLTYPQEILPGETYTQDTFETYYFAADVLVAVIGEIDLLKKRKGNDGSEVQCGIEEATNGRKWENCIAGCYYVKPNYPGRSSHICNAGFLVPPSMRGNGVGSVLARSFLYYAPRLGYEASVFNLVYVNNIASVRLWESLNFTKAGRIPRAGLPREDVHVRARQYSNLFGIVSTRRQKNPRLIASFKNVPFICMRGARSCTHIGKLHLPTLEFWTMKQRSALLHRDIRWTPGVGIKSQSGTSVS